MIISRKDYTLIEEVILNSHVGHGGYIEGTGVHVGEVQKFLREDLRWKKEAKEDG